MLFNKGDRYLVKLGKFYFSFLTEILILEVSNTAFKIKYLSGIVEWVEKKETSNWQLIEKLESNNRSGKRPKTISTLEDFKSS